MCSAPPPAPSSWSWWCLPIFLEQLLSCLFGWLSSVRRIFLCLWISFVLFENPPYNTCAVLLAACCFLCAVVVFVRKNSSFHCVCTIIWIEIIRSVFFLAWDAETERERENRDGRHRHHSQCCPPLPPPQFEIHTLWSCLLGTLDRFFSLTSHAEREKERSETGGVDTILCQCCYAPPAFKYIIVHSRVRTGYSPESILPRSIC